MGWAGPHLKSPFSSEPEISFCTFFRFFGWVVYYSEKNTTSWPNFKSWTFSVFQLSWSFKLGQVWQYRVSHKKVYLVTAFSYDSNTVTKTVLLYINECGIENKVYFYQSICSIRHLTRTILFLAVNFLTARNRIIDQIFQ